MSLGYDKNLYILAFDHRGSFRKMLGVTGTPTADDMAKIADAKALIFEGLEVALDSGAPKDASGALCDEESAAGVARAAKAAGIVFAMPAEKSGQDEFDFEYDDWAQHIEDFDPDFCKVLVRYNPDDDATMNARQTEKLAQLASWLHDNDRKFLFELLVPASEGQLASVGGDGGRYDTEVRPGLMVQVIQAMQAGGVEADIWKIEGVDDRADCERIAATARAGGRDGVGCVVLGRGANSAKVDEWLRAGAGVPGYLGFAIGRTIWSDALSGFGNGSITRDDARATISANFLHAVDVNSKAETAS